MTTTATAVETNKSVLDIADPDKLADVLRKVKLGTLLTPLKRTITLATVAASCDLTAVDASGETTGPSNPNRLAALSVITLRVTDVTGGTGAAGPRSVTDAGGTPAAPPTATAYAGASIGLATLSDDGKTVTFEGTVKAFIIEYIPRASVTMTDEFKRA